MISNSDICKNLISVKDLCFSYGDNSDTVLDHVSTNIKPGEFIAIIGRNGSGKSTLAKNLNALFMPLSGDVFVDGLNTKDESQIFNIRKTVGLAFQNPDNQIVAGIVEEDVAFGPENLGIEPAVIRKLVDSALTAVDMYIHKDDVVSKLSGGQKQRVSIAGILAMKPKCIVFDESTSMLDPKGRKEVMDVINFLHKENGVGVALITHFMEETVLADRLIVMEDGKIIRDDSPTDIFSDQEFLKAHELYTPECMNIILKLRSLGANIPLNAITTDGCVEALDKFIREAPSNTVSSTIPNTKRERKSKIISGDSSSAVKIKTSNLTHIYSKKTFSENIALSGIDISINSGEFIGIIGQTGSGKSTFIKHLNKLLKPSGGTVFIDDYDIFSKDSRNTFKPSNVGMVFQYPEHQLFEETVCKDISFGPRNMGLPENTIEERVLASADFVGLDRKLLTKSPFELSGGEKRKAAIAGVIAMDPDILILDEPCAGLDPKSKETLLCRLWKYHEKRKNTVLLVSHYMDDIAKYAERVMVLNKGKLEMFNKTSDVFSKTAELLSYGLDLPTITKITEELRKKGHTLSAGIISTDDALDEVLSCRNSLE